MNAEQHQVAADLWTKPTTITIYYLLSLKTDIHFTIPWRVEG